MAGQSNILSEMPVKENLILATFWIECLIVGHCYEVACPPGFNRRFKTWGPSEPWGQLARKMEIKIVGGGGGEGYSLK